MALFLVRRFKDTLCFDRQLDLTQVRTFGSVTGWFQHELEEDKFRGQQSFVKNEHGYDFSEAKIAAFYNK